MCALKLALLVRACDKSHRYNIVMLDTQLEVLQGIRSALEAGQKATLVSVIKTWGNAPRPVGALLAVASNGRFWGSVSGGCVEDDLIGKLIEQPVDTPELAIYGETDEERQRFGLPCGGTLELLLEPLRTTDDVDPLIKALDEREIFIRETCLETRKVTVSALTEVSKTPPVPEFDGKVWRNIFGPAWRLLIIGAGQTSRYLADMAMGMGYSVSISDPRPEYRLGWDLPAAPLLEGYPDDVVTAFNPDARTAIVALTHDPRLDDAALLTALYSNAFYVGALGSIRTNNKRRERFREHFDFDDQTLDKLHGPVGLPIGSKSPPEIALAVLAELTALRNGVDLRARLDNAATLVD